MWLRAFEPGLHQEPRKFVVLYKSTAWLSADHWLVTLWVNFQMNVLSKGFKFLLVTLLIYFQFQNNYNS